ncbi:MAG: ABC transporter substrate-binding protein [Bauldia sp.]|nr:ABC transporter substrate-binding protein [Bauldia sp.]
MKSLRHILAAGLAAVLLAVPAAAQETFTYAYGDYTAALPAEPQRVFVMDSRTGLEFALLAGFPIVATDADPNAPSHLDALLGPEVVRLGGFRGQPSAETVLSHDPDLLVVGAGWWNYWTEHGEFPAGFPVPVLVVADGDADTWRDTMTGQLAAYGLAERAEAALVTYDAFVAEARPEIERILAGRPIAITDIWNGAFSLHVATFDNAIARDLGIVTVSGDAPTEYGYQAYSLEAIGPVVESAALIMALDAADPVTANPVWLRIPAVASGNVYRLDLANSWGFALNALDFGADLLAAVRALGGVAP